MDNNAKTNNQLIFGKFKLIKKIGEGSAGKVYSGVNVKTQEKVAIKFESKLLPLNFLKSEAFYLFMLKSVGIPKLKAFGRFKTYNILVENLLGDSLDTILKKNKNKLPLKDSLMIAIQVIERLEYLHSKYLIHRDIKPSNFLIGYDDPYIIYLIDFGLIKKYRSTRTGNHVKFKVTKYYSGTVTFASLNSLRGIEVSRRDDLESVAYMLVYLMKGSLPWITVKGKTKYDRFKKIFQMKLAYNAEELCKNLPNEIMLFFLYCQNLNFEQDPDYKYCYTLFNNALIKHGYSNDLIFSWIKDSKIKDKLRQIKDKRNLNLGIPKRKSSPQARLYNILLNTSESQKSMQSSKIMDSLDNSNGNKYLVNYGITPIYRHSNTIPSNNNISAKDKKIINCKLSNFKRYHRICVEPISNSNNFYNQKLSESANSFNNLRKINKINHAVSTKTKNFIIPKIKNDKQYISRNKKNLIILNGNYFYEAKKENISSKSTYNSAMNLLKSASSDKGKKLYLNTIYKNRKEFGYKNNNCIKTIGNKIINNGLNTIINNNNQSSKGKSIINKTFLKKIKPKLKINLNDAALKTKMKNLRYTNFFERKRGFFSKNGKTVNKTFEKLPMNNNNIYKSKWLKNSPAHFEINYFKKENNTIFLNGNNIPGLKKLNSVKKNNISTNSNSLLSLKNNLKSNFFKNKLNLKSYCRKIKIKDNILNYN